MMQYIQLFTRSSAGNYIFKKNRFLKNMFISRLKVRDSIGFIVVIIFMLCAILGDRLTPYDPYSFDFPNRLLTPSSSHIFGTDEFGRDIFSRVIAGSRISFLAAICILGINAFIGSVLGMFAGFMGKLLDNVIMKLTGVFLSIPLMVLAIAITSMLGPGLNSSVIALSVVFWPYYTRIIRSRVLIIREQEFIKASVALGANTPYLIFKHILPSVLPILITKITLDVGSVILTLGTISFLGLGAQPPTPEWGALILSGRDYLKDYWWLVTFPGLCLTIVCLGFNLLGDSLQDYLIGDIALS